MTYAARTEVPVSRSRAHIEQLLEQYKADSIGIVIETLPRPRATVGFRIKGWGVRMRISLPTEADFRHEKNARGWLLGEGDRKKRAAQATRELWRALFLTLKAKLVSVESGVETFEEAFLPHLVLRGGATVYESAKSQLLPGTASLQLGSGT